MTSKFLELYNPLMKRLSHQQRLLWTVLDLVVDRLVVQSRDIKLQGRVQESRQRYAEPKEEGRSHGRNSSSSLQTVPPDTPQPLPLTHSCVCSVSFQTAPYDFFFPLDIPLKQWHSWDCANGRHLCVFSTFMLVQQTNQPIDCQALVALHDRG